jgi:hypothetical protein
MIYIEYITAVKKVETKIIGNNSCESGRTSCDASGKCMSRPTKMKLLYV